MHNMQDPELKTYQHTAIDEFSRYRILDAYSEQSTFSSAHFLKTILHKFTRSGVRVECVQTENGFEFTNRFSNSKRNLPSLLEVTAAKLGIQRKLIRPYTPSITARLREATAKTRSASMIPIASPPSMTSEINSLFNNVSPTLSRCAPPLALLGGTLICLTNLHIIRKDPK